VVVSVLLGDVGVLVTRRTLDRETTPEHHLTVVARDGGGLQCRSEVRVTLSDVNDNAPQFVPDAHYTGSVKEDASVGTPILRVAAVDPDIGLNRRVRYSMEPPHVGAVFAVDAVSGVITLLQSLDREQQTSYDLTVSAIDQVESLVLVQTELVRRLSNFFIHGSCLSLEIFKAIVNFHISDLVTKQT